MFQDEHWEAAFDFLSSRKVDTAATVPVSILKHHCSVLFCFVFVF